jgi:hypothetical protein
LASNWPEHDIGPPSQREPGFFLSTATPGEASGLLEQALQRCVGPQRGFPMATFEYNDEDDIEGMYDFIAEADIVEGPDELWVIVSELWPELLHKLKPPRALMH